MQVVTPPDAPAPDDQPGVLSGLSRTRPQRRSAKRPDAATPAAKPPAATAKPASGPKAKTAGKAPAKPRTKVATKPKASTAAKPKAAPKPGAAPARRVEPVMARPESAAPKAAAEEPRKPEQGQVGGVELVAQAIQAAGEVAQLGVNVGRQVAKGVLSRLPRP